MPNLTWRIIIQGNKMFFRKLSGICLPCQRYRFDPWVTKIPWKRKWLPTPVFLPGESHGQRSLAGYSPQGQSRTQLKRLSKNSVSQYNMSIVFLTVCLMMHVIFLWLIYFRTGGLFLLILFTYFITFPLVTPFPEGIVLTITCICLTPNWLGMGH